MVNNNISYGHEDWSRPAYQEWVDKRITTFAQKMQRYHLDFRIAEAHTAIGLPSVMGGLRISQESELESA